MIGSLLQKQTKLIVGLMSDSTRRLDWAGTYLL
jgi:hypothetical protein